MAIEEEGDCFWRATVDALAAHVAVLDQYGVIVATNASWDRYGKENGGVSTVGADYLGVCVDAGEDEGARATLDGLRAVLTGEAEQVELEYPCHAPHEQRWFVMRAARHRSDGPTRIVVSHEEITKSRRAEREVSQRMRVLDAAGAALVATDSAGRVTLWNRGAEKTTGWTSEEALGRPITELAVQPGNLFEAAAIRARVQEFGMWQGRFDVVRRDGTSFPALMRNVAVKGPNGEPAGVVGFIVDLTAIDEPEPEPA